MAHGSYSILCAAPGTELTRIAAQLAQEVERAAVSDLEDQLCADYLESHSHVYAAQPSMGQLILKQPRSELRTSWRSAWRKCISNLKALGTQAERQFIALHLTWYNPSTSEFFVPVDYSLMAELREQVDNVIVLIDDVLEMYGRLRQPGDLYDDDGLRGRKNLLVDYWNLSVPDSGNNELQQLSLDHDTLSRNLQYVDRNVQAACLNRLMTWRDAEMIQAENLAGMLEADLAVVGTKHCTAAVAALLQDKSTPRIYLSHRISEARRLNISSVGQQNPSGTWPAICDEVNLLHALFADRSQLLINPTAIDEMRFSFDENTLDERVRLAARWPLAEDRQSLMWEPPTDLVDDSGAVIPELWSPSGQAAPGYLTRSFSQQVFDDVAFRDHLIVEHTPHLCVYRPFYSAERHENGVDWSGGVRPEIQHWQSKSELGENESRVAFVNTADEINAHLRFLKDDSRILGRFWRMVEVHLAKELLTEDIDLTEVLADLTGNEVSGLQTIPARVSVVTARRVLNYLDVSTVTALDHHFCLDKSLSDSADRRNRRLMYVVDADSHGRVSQLHQKAAVLCEFFGGELDADEVEDRYQDFDIVRATEFKKVFGRTPAEAYCERVNVSFEALETRSSE